MSQVSAIELENQVFDKEGIRVIIRAPRNTMFEEYNFIKKAAANTSITDWYYNRLKPILGDEYDADIIDGHGVIPHGRTGIEKVRNSYAK